MNATRSPSSMRKEMRSTASTARERGANTSATRARRPAPRGCRVLNDLLSSCTSIAVDIGDFVEESRLVPGLPPLKIKTPFRETRKGADNAIPTGLCGRQYLADDGREVGRLANP